MNLTLDSTVELEAWVHDFMTPSTNTVKFRLLYTTNKKSITFEIMNKQIVTLKIKINVNNSWII